VWQAFLYDIAADRAETTDLWRSQRTIAQQMLGRFLKWQTSVFASQQVPKQNGLPALPPPRTFSEFKMIILPSQARDRLGTNIVLALGKALK
jgi:hypothetical protein